MSAAIYRSAACGYCARYGKACGRPHVELAVSPAEAVELIAHIRNLATDAEFAIGAGYELVQISRELHAAADKLARVNA